MRPLADEGDTVVIALRIPRDLKERFRVVCKDRAMSEVMRLLIEEHVKREAPPKRRRTKKERHGHSRRD